MKWLAKDNGIKLSTQIINKRLHLADTRTRRPAIRITVTWKDIKARLQWARAHVRGHWMTGTQYCSLTNSYYVWRSSTERFVPIYIASHHRLLEAQSADISMQANTDLYVVQKGIPSAARYVIYISDVKVPPYAGTIGPDFILFDGNAHPDLECVTNKYLQIPTMETMD